ncbi:MAG: leucyl aminopeptidase [Cellulosilyticaceae bacterium]
MNIKINNQVQGIDGIIVPVFENRAITEWNIQKFKDSQVFTGKEGEVFYYTDIQETLKYIILVGLGKEQAVDVEGIRCAVAKAIKKSRDLKLKRLSVALMDTEVLCTGSKIKAVTEGLELGLYEFNKYKSEKVQYEPEVFITNVPNDHLEKANMRLEEVEKLIEGVIIARDLVNEPSNVIYPQTLALEAKRVAQLSGCEIEVFDENYINEIGMKAFWSVGMGSENMPRLIVMRYMGDPSSKEILGLVGKGLTYDTGGYSLKPSTSMDTMKSDMGGAASVIGTMSAIAKNKLKKNVVAVVAACENCISGRSYKPGDIIGSMAGKTIEVLNTDAEGRLTLVDAVTYAIRKEHVTKVIDVATLTGAALVALGTNTTAVVTNNDAFYEELMQASEKSSELFWKLPTYKHYKKQLKGEIADLKNTGGRNAGTIVAGLFIGEFVEDKPWLHLDIAGTSWAESNEDYVQKGATGVPVRTLYYLVKGECSCKN